MAVIPLTEPKNPCTGHFPVEMWPIDRPKDYEKNARKWSGQAIGKVASSIREYGWWGFRRR